MCPRLSYLNYANYFLNIKFDILGSSNRRRLSYNLAYRHTKPEAISCCRSNLGFSFNIRDLGLLKTFMVEHINCRRILNFFPTALGQLSTGAAFHLIGHMSTRCTNPEAISRCRSNLGFSSHVYSRHLWFSISTTSATLNLFLTALDQLSPVIKRRTHISVLLAMNRSVLLEKVSYTDGSIY